MRLEAFRCLSGSFAEVAGDRLFVEERVFGLLLGFLMMRFFLFAEDLQRLFGAVRFLKLLAGQPFGLAPRSQLATRLIVSMLGILPESSLPLHRYRIGKPDNAGKSHQAMPHVPNVLFLLPPLVYGPAQVLTRPLGLVPAQLEHTFQRKAEFLSGHPLPFYSLKRSTRSRRFRQKPFQFWILDFGFWIGKIPIPV